jgi:hypothetical protein
MIRHFVALTLLLGGILCLNITIGCATDKQRENGSGILSPAASQAINETKNATDALAASPVPLIAGIASSISALLGGVLLIDKVSIKRKATNDGAISGG